MGELALILFWFHFITPCIIPLVKLYFSCNIQFARRFYVKRRWYLSQKSGPNWRCMFFQQAIFVVCFGSGHTKNHLLKLIPETCKCRLKFLCGIDSLFFWSCTWSWPWIRFALVDRHGVRDIIIFRFSCQAHIIYFYTLLSGENEFLTYLGIVARLDKIY